ncbi:trypsin-like cysteine/serine peptidase domain-containing protein [Emericellopsis atlantica]|uniref:Trypsin-like cysteine/serine peptidase domain-containing protein n=1 Tax=Emericellopsis atlantica TaxID=2614577 RepID=A0A9P8CQ50_9HYPO|nr:trypsin-like cysteine/serine peptidase domain-containing protein [Emericellopsis atlantica]KAG9254760.1 trypsin-like cysteine/serine peptidase domain-containing protein [Emericellopsis atlantica]
MARFLTAAATAACLLAHANANPVAAREEKVTMKNLLGFDESLINPSALSDDTVIPEITYIQPEDAHFADGATEAAPLTITEEQAKTLSERFINGADDRYQYTDGNYPFRNVGKLFWDNGVFCSGALIGPRHVLTAKHCIVDGVTGYFAPGFDNGEPYGRGRVTNIVSSGYEWGSACGFKGDWAVMILDNRLGDQLGYFGVKLPEASKQDQSIFDHVGYPGDRDGGNRPYRTPGNTVQSFRPWDCDATGPFYTDTDCMGGQSGGPHWENTGDGAYIWGTLSVTFDGGNGVAWSGWGSGNEMLDTVLRLRSEFP